MPLYQSAEKPAPLRFAFPRRQPRAGRCLLAGGALAAGGRRTTARRGYGKATTPVTTPRLLVAPDGHNIEAVLPSGGVTGGYRCGKIHTSSAGRRQMAVFGIAQRRSHRRAAGSRRLRYGTGTPSGRRGTCYGSAAVAGGYYPARRRRVTQALDARITAVAGSPTLTPRPLAPTGSSWRLRSRPAVLQRHHFAVQAVIAAHKLSGEQRRRAAVHLLRRSPAAQWRHCFGGKIRSEVAFASFLIVGDHQRREAQQ